METQLFSDICLALLSTFCFLLLRYLLYFYSAYPKLLETKRSERLYWFNVLVSFVHSLITGTWCLLCFYNDPDMASDLINVHGKSAHTLVTVSTGYFLYDVIDSVSMFPFSKVSEIVFHHIVVITCFGIAVLRHEYVGYAVVALLVEVNSVFLHLRQLFRLSHVDIGSKVYRINCIANLGTFVLFRICTLTWMTRWLVLNKVPQPYHGIGVVGMALMTLINAILFIRLIIKDIFGRDPKRYAGAKEPAENGTAKSQTDLDIIGLHRSAKVE